MLGTTRFLTDASGGQIEPAVYTAFGELVSGTSGRFGYVGAHGYQTSDEMPYQHVGARYYDPTSGRFLQRDPIGIVAGINVYEYLRSCPGDLVDPTGQVPDSNYWHKKPSKARRPSLPPHPVFSATREGMRAFDPRHYDPRGRGSKLRHRKTGRFMKRQPLWRRAWRWGSRILDVASLCTIPGDNAPMGSLDDQTIHDIINEKYGLGG